MRRHREQKQSFVSKIVDGSGAIIDARILRAYERIAGPRRDDGRTAHASKVDSAESFLRMVLRMESAGKIDSVYRTLSR